jgi:MarR family transcriptional regulator, organic hydroperoxide resistance regulator
MAECTNETIFDCCLYFTANRLGRLMNDLAEEAFAEIGLSPAYVFLLMLIQEQPGISIKTAAERMYLAQSTLSRFADKLESSGLIIKEPSGKTIHLTLSRKGASIQDDIRRCWKKLHERYSDLGKQPDSDDLSDRIRRYCDRIDAGR